MRNRFIRTISSITVLAALLLSSCRSAEVNKAITIANGDFGGIMLDTAAESAESAAPIPEYREETYGFTYEDEFILYETAEDTAYETTEADVPETAPAVTTAAATTKITTTAAATKVTTAETVLTTTEKTTVAVTSKPAEKTTSAAAETTATTSAAAKTTAETTVTTTTTAKTTVTTNTTAETTVSETSAATEVTEAETSAAAEVPSSGRSYGKNSYSALNYSNVKAVWISYIEIGNILLGKNESSFRSTIGAMYDNCAAMGINTVYVHVRSYGDAFYYSDLFPFTKYISGTVGVKTSYDPLKIMVDEAHKRKISFHAWINPLRLCNTTDMPNVSAAFPEGKWYNGDKKGTYIVNISNVWYLNPAYDETIRLIGDGVREIVSKYDVDGIHIDDYFYPTTDASFDSAAYSASGYSSLASFRTERCNAMVKEIYNAAHECGSAIFGAAPQGNNINNLNVLYADTKAWCKGGYIDYFTPQIYYGFENSGVPYASCVDSWCSIVSGTKTKLNIGLALYKIGNEDTWAGSGKYEWQNTTTMIKRQIEYAAGKNCGIALYSYNYLFSDGYVTSAIKTEINNFKSLLTD